MEDRIQKAAEHLQGRMPETPLIGLVTGTGLGGLTSLMEVQHRIPYREIPFFPESTTKGHPGNLVYGTLGVQGILGMEGRFHLYEGYTPYEVTFPIRVMARLGIKYLFISSAAGGLNPLFLPGDVMMVTDHINLMFQNPLTGPNLDVFGPRFPDMSRVYDPELLGIARKTALKQGIELRQGVYVGIPGPSLETPAETRFLRMIGADAVGMSTVPEVVVGVHCGLKIGVIVAVTNVNLPDCMQASSIEEVIANAERAGVVLTRLWRGVIEELGG